MKKYHQEDALLLFLLLFFCAFFFFFLGGGWGWGVVGGIVTGDQKPTQPTAASEDEITETMHVYNLLSPKIKVNGTECIG